MTKSICILLKIIYTTMQSKELDNKSVIEKFIIDESTVKSIIDYIDEFKDDSVRVLNLNEVQKEVFNNKAIITDFSKLEVLKSVDINSSTLLQYILSNLIEERHGILLSNKHSTTYWEKTWAFTTFEFLDGKEQKRLSWFGETTIKKMVDAFVNTDWIEKKIEEKIIKRLSKNYCELSKKLLSNEFIDEILDIIKEVFEENTNSILIDYLNDKSIVWMRQSFYRENFEELNNKRTKLLLDKIKENIIDSKSKQSSYIIWSIAKEMLKINLEWDRDQNINSILEKEGFKNRLINNISKEFEKLIKSNNFEINEFQKTIYEIWMRKWIWLIKSIFSTNYKITVNDDISESIIRILLLKWWPWSISFDLSCNVFMYLKEASMRSDKKNVDKILKLFNWNKVENEDSKVYLTNKLKLDYLNKNDINKNWIWQYYNQDNTTVSFIRDMKDLFDLLKNWRDNFRYANSTEEYDNIKTTFSYLNTMNSNFKVSHLYKQTHNDTEKMVSEFAYHLYKWIESLSFILTKFPKKIPNKKQD